MRYLLLILLIPFIFASCNAVKTVTGSEDIPSLVEKVAKRSPNNHKNLVGSNDFNSVVQGLIVKISPKLKRYLMVDDVVLVSDFVNVDKLENRSKLGFLLSEHLKDSLINQDVIVRQVELSENFSIGQKGFNLLTREQRRLSNKSVDGNYAVVGTYTITTESLIVFIKLIDIRNGNILAAANASTTIDDEILELEGMRKERQIVLPPRMVL